MSRKIPRHYLSLGKLGQTISEVERKLHLAFLQPKFAPCLRNGALPPTLP
jgi:hypothetical protein